MSVRVRFAGVAAGATAVLLAGTMSLLAQDPDQPKGEVAASKRSTPQASRRVPPFFGQVGLTPTQKEKVYEIRGKHRAEIEALEAQIEAVEDREMAECESVLEDAQKKLLAQPRDGAKTKSRTRSKGPAPKAGD